MKNFSTRKIVTVAALAALSVVFRVFLGYPQTGNTRYDLGFLPICAVGMLFGPVWSGVAYVLADLVGTFAVGQTPFIPITLCKFIFGFIFGLFFYKKEPRPLRIILCVLTISVAVDLIAMPISLYFLMGNSIWAVAVSRIVQVCVMFPVRVVGIWLMNRYLGRYILRYRAD